MKWPETLTLMRHGVSEYNALKKEKEESPHYQKFKKSYDKYPYSIETVNLALEIVEKFALNKGDHDTALAQDFAWQAVEVGKKLKDMIPLPDMIFYSPYQRTEETLNKLMEGWPQLRNVEKREEDNIREQDHGLALLYNDWRVFNTLHPEQIDLHQLQGDYWYRYPQGESVSDVRGRIKDWFDTLVRDYKEKNVLAVSHHLTILSIRSKFERFGAKEFIRLDQEEKPINCGVTIYRADKNQGTDGKLVLEAYNLKLY